MTVPGKGGFIYAQDSDAIREMELIMARDHRGEAVAISKSHCVKREKLSELFDLLCEK